MIARSDELDELPDAENIFHGGLGLFTRNGLPKPVYHAYCFLKRLEDICLESGKGYFITANRDRSRFSIILYHYHHFLDMYAEGFPAGSSADNRYAEFSREESDSQDCPGTFGGEAGSDLITNIVKNPAGIKPHLFRHSPSIP